MWKPTLQYISRYSSILGPLYTNVNAESTLRWCWWYSSHWKSVETVSHFSILEMTSLISVRAVSQASLQHCLGDDADAWCKLALTVADLQRKLRNVHPLCFVLIVGIIFFQTPQQANNEGLQADLLTQAMSELTQSLGDQYRPATTEYQLSQRLVTASGTLECQPSQRLVTVSGTLEYHSSQRLVTASGTLEYQPFQCLVTASGTFKVYSTPYDRLLLHVLL